MKLIENKSIFNKSNFFILLPKEKKIKPVSFNSHVKYNELIYLEKQNFLSPLNGEKFYFNHGYFYQGKDEYILGTTNFNKTFASIINNKNSYGFQFHPEKSQVNGAKLLKYTIDAVV